MQRILLIGLQESSILPALTDAAYTCVMCSPEEGPLLGSFEKHRPDALILELGADNLLLQHVRRILREELNVRPIPLLALARRAHLNPPHLIVGVDDFLLTPIMHDELLARLQMLFWRFQRANVQNCIEAGEMTLDMARHAVTIGNRPVPLSLREYQLLQFLMTHRGRTFTRESLLAQVWGYHFEGDVRVVDAYIKRVRSRLFPPYGRMVETVRGIGYRFDASAAVSVMMEHRLEKPV